MAKVAATPESLTYAWNASGGGPKTNVMDAIDAYVHIKY